MGTKHITEDLMYTQILLVVNTSQIKPLLPSGGEEETQRNSYLTTIKQQIYLTCFI